MTLNSLPINYTTPPASIIAGEYAFDGFSLMSENMIIRTINNDDLENIDLSQYEIAYNHGENIVDRYYRGRVIKITGAVRAKTAEEFDTFLDTMKKALSKKNAFFKFKNRKIKATVTAIKYNRDHYHITFSPLEIVMKTTDAFWTS